ncbi:flagellar hook-associated protein FlgK [Paenibacillus donghaensis]|uniref:Flagellar hook-associated protein 1 n=1 Tax=Paenibacillus donghaensis TaxID=414771 RepID=A0A2Z2KEI6_9BACL|nr:flagellar hook-associated protein FlgK [Paenibacillus donghaensis]ASA24494.1 flagellar hook-associated protein FlgK [Paenibacillus donghaensis]
MTSTFHSIETARRSLFTQTTALNTTGHNIANANTEGYSRQRVNMTASRPMEAYGIQRSSVPGQLGTGVEFTSIERIREGFLDDQFRGENAAMGNWSIQSDTLDKLEAIINEPSDTGIRTVLDNFWKSWSDLSKSPEDPTARKIVVQTAQALTDAINYMDKQLKGLSSDLSANLDTKGSEIQGYLGSIRDLNESITKIEGMGDHANDLRDQRDLLTDKLSKIINITVVDGEAGYTISMGTQQLLQGINQPVVISNPAVPNSGNVFLNNAFAAGSLTGGETYGMIFSNTKYVADYQKQLDGIANTLATGELEVTIPAGSNLPAGTVVLKESEITNPDGTKVTLAAGAAVPVPLTGDLKTTVKGMNGLHELGYAMNGTSGRPFFTPTTPGAAITAANLQLNPLIAADPTLFATSLRTTVDAAGNTKVITGNNTMALLISNLKDNSSFTSADGLKKGSIGSYLSSMVGQLGIQSQEATRQNENSNYLLDQVSSRRQSVSGVSLDEEMTNMLVYQHAYSAAARFMTTYDELLDKLINSTGTVGR